MDSDGLPLVGDGIDYTKVGAIHQKRTLAFLNHFVVHTARFLNRFSCVCEEKLEGLTVRLQRLETTMSILEAKLSSIPGLENVKVAATSAPASDTSSQQPAASTQQTVAATEPAQTQQSTDTQESAPPAEPVQEEKPVMTVAQDPRYAKYFKMVNMGVPAGALRAKMAAEGLDPDLLETPNAPAPGGGETKQDDDSDFSEEETKEDSGDDDSDAGFSD